MFLLHRLRSKFTLIPLYCFIAVLTLLTHNLADLGFAVVAGDWYFLISSFSFFTTLMLGVLFLYLFEGPRATRLSLWIILFVSCLYISLVWALGFLTNTSNWIVLDAEKIKVYFWSIGAIVVDFVFLAILWELLAKLGKVPLVVRVFIVCIAVYFLDTAIFVTGAFGGQSTYVSMIKSNLTIRLVLALIMTPVASFYFQVEGYKEENRIKPKRIWEILNFRSDLEEKIETMEEAIKKAKKLEEELSIAKETYGLALEGANAGIWDWDIVKNHIMYSAKFCSLLGYEEGAIKTGIDDFKTILHPDDTKRVFDQVEKSQTNHSSFCVEYRLKNKDGTYKWYSCGGVVKYDKSGKPIRMVGSIIDIDEKKKLIKSLEEKMDELEKSNRIMVDRELQMVKLKEEITKLSQNKS